MTKILFLSANPLDISSPSSDKEVRVIDTALRQSEFGRQFELYSHWATRINDLQELLLRYRPDIVHYSGHGSSSGEIILENDQGNAAPVSIDTLSKLFSLLKDNIRCVVLNACYSHDQANAIAEHIDCVVGMSDAISEQAALDFARAFYRGLGYGRSAQEAFNLGQIELSKLNQQERPKLFADRIDPTQLIFANQDSLLPHSKGDQIQATLGNNVKNANVGKNISTVNTGDGGDYSGSYIAGSSIYIYNPPPLPNSVSEQARLNQLNRLKSQSRARCIASWQAVGLLHSEATSFADDPSIGSLKAEYEADSQRQLIILTAELGTGKSLILERLYQQAINRSIAQPTARIPIYLEAAKCAGKLIEYLESLPPKFQELGNADEQGLAIFIDEVDRVGHDAAQNIKKESWILVNSNQNTTVTLASRPLHIFNGIEGEVKVPPMSEEEAKQFITKVANKEKVWLGWWPRSIQDAVRRPLFALILGIHLRQEHNKKFLSTGELISELVWRSFGENPDQYKNAKHLLEKLAVLCIERSGSTVLKNEVGTYDEVQMLVESRLIIENSGTIGFALPILTEWFAAHSLASGYPLPMQLLDEQTIEKWRYPLTIFVAIFNHAQVSAIFAPLCTQFPAIASEILAKGISQWGEPEHDTVLTKQEYGEQIRDTMQAWVTGIGPLAKLIAPVNSDNSLRSLCIAQQGQHLTYAWYFGPGNLPEVSNFPVKPLAYPSPFRVTSSIRIGRQSAWIWKETQRSLIDALSNLLKKRQLPITCGPLLDEMNWETALALSHYGSLWPHPIPLQELTSHLQNLPEQAIIVSGRKKVGPNGIKQLKLKVDELRNTGEVEFSPPWPTSNLVQRNGWIWESYTEERLLERTIWVYQAALQSYKQITETWFPNFASRLQIAAMLPAKFVGIIEIQKKREPIMQWYWEPLTSGAQSHVDIQLGDIPWQFDEELFFRKARENLRFLRADSHQWMYTSLNHANLSDILQLNPITEVVYDWLWDDLKKIAWVKGML